MIRAPVLIAPFSAVTIAVMGLIAVPAIGQTTPPASVQSTSGPPASTPSADDLIVFRAHAEPTAFSPTIEVDGAKIVSLPNRHYTSVNIAPGIHTLTIAWPRLSGQRSTEMSFDIKGSEPHYFEVTGTSRVAGFGFRAVYIREQSGMAEIAPDRAQETIANCCKYKAPTAR